MTTIDGTPRHAGQTEWRSLRVRYYADNKDDLILDAVRPLFREFAGKIEQPYFVRHWRQGPHLRLNFRCSSTEWNNTVLPAATGSLTDFLRRHPSTAVLDEVAELRRHQRMADQEGEIGALRPWYPDNSIQCEPYEDRRHILGSQELTDLLDASYAESSELAFAMLDHVRNGPANVLLVALDLMFAFAHTSVPPIPRGFMSYRSHAEGFLARCEDPAAVRSGFDAKYRQQRVVLANRLTAVLETLDGAGEVPFVKEWTEIMQRQKALAEPLFTTGKISLNNYRPAGSAGYKFSELHELLHSTEAYRQETGSSIWFQCHRIAINQLYSHLSRLGIVPMQRFLFCHLVANTVEDVFGVSALERAREYVAGHPG